MNYYERHLGDYARDTAHLSVLEHGVYTLLLDRYYATERPIPEAEAHRLARARSADERAAVDAVLVEFFVLVDGFWTHERCDAEIVKANARIDAAKRNGTKGGRPRKPSKNPDGTQTKPSGFSVGSENETQPKAPQAPCSKPQFSVGSTEASTQGFAGKPTEAGRACLLMRQAGCASTNPSHPDLLDALAEGVTPEALGDTAREAIEGGKRKPFAWAIEAARGRHAEAKAQPPRELRATGTGPPPLSKTGAAYAALNLAADRLDPEHATHPRSLVSVIHPARTLPPADAEP